MRYTVAATIGVGALLWLTVAHSKLPEHTIPQSQGVVDITITEANKNQTICKAHWTDSVRPSSSITNAIKKIQLGKEATYIDKDPAHYEEDHIISLELGGHPFNVNNLWPQPYKNDFNGQNLGAREKDRAESYLHNKVCKGLITLKEAQEKIRKNWVEVYAEARGLNYTAESETDQ